MKKYYLTSNRGNGSRVEAYASRSERDLMVRDDATARKQTRRDARRLSPRGYLNYATAPVGNQCEPWAEWG